MWSKTVTGQIPRLLRRKTGIPICIRCSRRNVPINAVETAMICADYNLARRVPISGISEAALP